MHGVQHTNKKNINVADAVLPQPKPSTQLMRISNVWRSFGHHDNIHNEMVRLYGPGVAAIHTKTVMGGVCRSRWGTFEGPEIVGLLAYQSLCVIIVLANF